MAKRQATQTHCNRIQLLRSGKPYFDKLLELIHGASQLIHLQTYIFDNDETGQMVAKALMDAAARKVKVYLIADGYASGKMTRALVKELQENGVEFRFFNPLFKGGGLYFGRRLHQKVVVVDSTHAMVGGLNISNRYNDMPGKPAWLDFAVYLEGESAMELCTICWKTWMNYPRRLRSNPCTEVKPKFEISEQESCTVSVQRNDWVRRKKQITNTYVKMFRGANSHIVILCSYFIPGRVIRRAIKYASRRGVRITVITAGISDVKTAKFAERFLYDWLLRHNIELYEYQAGVLHGKLAVCDSEWMTVGSFNINDISTYASIELNVNVHNAPVVKDAEQLLHAVREKDCIHISKDYHIRSKNIIKRFLYWCSYIFFRALFHLFTFYFRPLK